MKLIVPKRFKSCSTVEEERMQFRVHRQIVPENDVKKIHDARAEMAKANLRLRAKELLSSKRTDRDLRAEELSVCNSEAQRKVDLKVSEFQSIHVKTIHAAEILNGSLNEELSTIKLRLVIE
jgi:hypothetical protein